MNTTFTFKPIECDYATQYNYDGLPYAFVGRTILNGIKVIYIELNTTDILPELIESMSKKINDWDKEKGMDII